jgi:hypothetical protein
VPGGPRRLGDGQHPRVPAGDRTSGRSAYSPTAMAGPLLSSDFKNGFHLVSRMDMLAREVKKSHRWNLTKEVENSSRFSQFATNRFLRLE